MAARSLRLDMEFDKSIDPPGTTMMAETLKKFDSKPITPRTLRKQVVKVLEREAMLVVNKLGQWTIRQHDSNNHFTIVQLSDRKWYLQTRSEENEAVSTPLIACRGLKQFDFAEGFGALSLRIEKDKLQITDRFGKMVKISE